MKSFAEGHPAGEWELGVGPRQAYLSSPEEPRLDAREQTQDHVGLSSVEELCGSAPAWGRARRPGRSVTPWAPQGLCLALGSRI